ncbi:MAG: hypothetical protein RR736_11040 [Pseudomonas sp.]|uniref:hypothetical protein n=1 Tax=Pseudomonas sp. TaxID=306 RepID=UPI002FCB6ED0
MNALQLVMSGILIPSCALAADAVQLSPWAQEPTSFMGIDLQGDFLKDVEECPAATVTTQTLCRISTDTPDQYLIQGASSRRVLLGYQLVAQLSNGKIEKLVFSGPSNSSALVAEMLRTDYGPPSHSKTNLVKTRSGTMFDNEVLLWKGQKLSIESQRNDNDLSTYNVMFTNAPVSISNVQDAEQPSDNGVSQI